MHARQDTKAIHFTSKTRACPELARTARTWWWARLTLGAWHLVHSNDPRLLLELPRDIINERRVDVVIAKGMNDRKNGYLLTGRLKRFSADQFRFASNYISPCSTRLSSKSLQNAITRSLFCSYFRRSRPTSPRSQTFSEKSSKCSTIPLSRNENQVFYSTIILYNI